MADVQDPETVRSEPDWKWMFQDVCEQLRGAVDTINKLQDRVDALKANLVHHVDQGEGLTKDELAGVYAEIDRLFPRRVRKTADSIDDRSR